MSQQSVYSILLKWLVSHGKAAPPTSQDILLCPGIASSVMQWTQALGWWALGRNNQSMCQGQSRWDIIGFLDKILNFISSKFPYLRSKDWDYFLFRHCFLLPTLSKREARWNLTTYIFDLNLVLNFIFDQDFFSTVQAPISEIRIPAEWKVAGPNINYV